MKLSLQREDLLRPLQLVSGVIERRQILPILSNILLTVEDEKLKFLATDLEVVLQCYVTLPQKIVDFKEITVSGRKLMDICRILPDQSTVELHADEDKVFIHSNRSRFSLSTLPAKDFPASEKNPYHFTLTVPQKELRHLLARTYFAMAQQDVRYYLNGMFLEVNDGRIRAVATDGHRLALNTINAPVIDNNVAQLIVPYKAVTELLRLLEDSDEEITLTIGANTIGIANSRFTFTSKLLDGSYPDYNRVLPKNGDKTLLIDRDLFKQALTRAAVLSNEKFRSVSLDIQADTMRILANNPEHDEAEELVPIQYQGEPVTIGFNVSYLLDVLNAIQPGNVKITLSDGNSSILIEEAESSFDSLFVVMPMLI